MMHFKLDVSRILIVSTGNSATLLKLILKAILYGMVWKEVVVWKAKYIYI
jgi:hypothetical protein